MPASLSGTVAIVTPRLIAQPPIQLTRQYRLDPDADDVPPVEQAILVGLGAFPRLARRCSASTRLH